MGSEHDKTGFLDVHRTVMKQAENMSPASKADFVDTPPPQGASVDESCNYIVLVGDSLATIAAHFYGNANAWERLFEANRDQLTDPDQLQPGQMLKIPAKL